MGRLPVSVRERGCNGERRRARTVDNGRRHSSTGHRLSGLEKYVSPCNHSVSSANSSPAQSVQRGGGSGPAYTVSHRWHPKNRRPSTPQWTGGRGKGLFQAALPQDDRTCRVSGSERGIDGTAACWPAPLHGQGRLLDATGEARARHWCLLISSGSPASTR